ncbi:MAG: nuclear transport factor 2 family protein [Nocardioidaceae bacterium]|nr:MAG: nuclear transport factor 2 family protein [Nocardioidaceae bacterium]
MSENLEQRIVRLEEIEKARGLYYVYAETLDDPNPDTVTPLFTDNAVLHTPMGDFTGREAIHDFYSRAFAADTSVKRHFLTNSRVVAYDPGEVRLLSYFLYTGRGDDSSIIGWGTYDDLVDASGPEPLFKEKTIDVHMGTDLSVGWAKGAL